LRVPRAIDRSLSDRSATAQRPLSDLSDRSATAQRPLSDRFELEH